LPRVRKDGFNLIKSYKYIIFIVNNMFMRKQNICIAMALGGGWGAVGFKRGLHSYDYTYNKNINKGYDYTITGPYLYSYKFANGCFGVVLYLNPCLLFITIPKEMYRFEVNMRNLENAKLTDYYNELL